MPRNGSDVYFIPPGTEGFPDTTIESEKYNSYIHDVETDLNTPRPIISGGTGADNANEALANIGAEKSSQAVTNYDSHVFIPGSFYSATSATAAPVAGHAFTGYVTSSDAPADPPANLNVVVNARDQNDTIVPGRMYVREKKAGVWGLWKLDGVSLYVQDTPPTDAPDKSLWWESDSGLLYLRYNDGAGTPQWVIACPQPDISVFALKAETDLHAPINSPTFTGDPKAPTPTAGDNDTSVATTAFVSGAITTAVGGIPGAPSAVVRYDIAQTLTALQLIQARTNIYAAPYDAMAYSGMQINGGMEVSQERGVGGVTSTNATFICDNWGMYWTGSMVTSGTTVTPNDLAGFPNRLGMSTATAQASLGAGDFSVIIQSIEGYRVARLAWGTASAQPITIAFWSCHNRTGLFSVSIRNSPSNRSYATTYTQAAAAVWQYNTITIPGDTSGTWTKDNTTGMLITFSNGAGTTLTASSANTWLAGSFHAAPGQVNNVASTSDFFKITGVTILPGNEAPSAARSPFIMRPYDQELVTCKRYLWRITFVLNDFLSTLQAVNTQNANGPLFTFSPSMRIAPTVTVGPSIASFSLQPAGGGGNALFGFLVTTTPEKSSVSSTSVSGGLVAGDATLLFANVGSAWLQFDARL